MSVSFIDVVSFIKELLSDKEKLESFKEVVTDIKGLINSVKEFIAMCKGQ